MMITNIINGYELLNDLKLLDRYSNIGRKLIKKRLGLYNKPLPEYMIKIFNNICEQTDWVTLDICQLNANYLYNLDDIWNYKNGYKNWFACFNE